MNKFYVFLDIDGVLNNYVWIKKVYYSKDPNINKYISKDNVKILNNFLKTLSLKGFDVVLVISSAWRHDLTKTIKELYHGGLEYSGKFYRTGFGHDGVRGLQILDVINALNIKQNFVVIDDETTDITPHINSTNIIKTTGIFKLGLTEENTKHFLTKKLPIIMNNLDNTNTK